MWVQGHVTGRAVKVLAVEVGWSLAPRKEGLSGLLHDKNGPKGVAGADRIIHHIPWQRPHDFSALYETFEPEEAWRIREKIEIHYTPKHGSWLNMAEIELAVLNGQCLDRRIGEEETLRQEVAAWEAERNMQRVKVNWRFPAQDARIKLKRLYPVLEAELEEAVSV